MGSGHGFAYGFAPDFLGVGDRFFIGLLWDSELFCAFLPDWVAGIGDGLVRFAVAPLVGVWIEIISWYN